MLDTAQIEIFGKPYELQGCREDGWFRTLKQRGRYDFEFDLGLLRDFVKSDSVALDIGANIGVLSLAMAAIAEKGTVYAFEASPLAAGACLQNCAVAPNVVAKQAVIGRAGDHVTWTEDSRELTSAHYVPGGDIETISIDSLSLPRVDFIKIDVEGAELDVLDGAKETLRRCNPVVMLEFNTFAMVHYRGILPRDALAKIRQLFSSITVYTKRGGRFAVLEAGDDEQFLRYNFLNGLVDDLICHAKT